MMAGVTEKWIPQARQRQDLFGFVDLIAIDGENTIAIQATSGSNVSSRVNKITTECKDNAKKWLSANNRIQVWGDGSKLSEAGRLRDGSQGVWKLFWRILLSELNKLGLVIPWWFRSSLALYGERAL
jgi:hypothetical protein